MENIKEILERKKLKVSNSRINLKFEKVVEFLEYVGIGSQKANVFFTLKLCRIYGMQRVLDLRSWLKDIDIDKKRWKGLVIWKLQQRKV